MSFFHLQFQSTKSEMNRLSNSRNCRYRHGRVITGLPFGEVLENILKKGKRQIAPT